MVLSKTQEGWSDKHREEYFRLIHGARLFQGDEQMPRIVRQLEEDALARVPGASRARFSALLDSDDAVKDEPPVVSRPFVRSWQVSDFRFEELAELNVNFAVGKRVFREATCSKCHRLGAAGRAFGPDLTGNFWTFYPHRNLGINSGSFKVRFVQVRKSRSSHGGWSSSYWSARLERLSKVNHPARDGPIEHGRRDRDLQTRHRLA